jgi:hypothetical protein
MTYLISLISEHLLPNFLLAKEFAGKYDRHIFITTERMGKLSMTARLCKALGVDKKDVKIVVVSEDDLPNCRDKLQSENFSANNKYIVNLTGGTKIMSIATFQHFFKLTDEFYYVPIGTNKIETVKTGEDFPLNYRVNVKEYLSLYGLDFTNETTVKQNVAGDKGAEFEVYICNRMKSELGIKNEHIYRGVKLFREGDRSTDNEIDVMWTADNQLFIAECKVSLIGNPKEIDSYNRPVFKPAEYLDEIMYKLAAISKDLGIRVNSYIFINRPLPKKVNRKSAERRMKILGIKGLMDSNNLKNNKLNL